MKKILVFVCVALTNSAVGFVTLQFTAANGTLTNLSNSSSSSAVNGLAWGIVIDSLGDNFQKSLVGQVGLAMNDGADLGNGYLFYRGDELTKSIIGGQSGAAVAASELDYEATNNGKSFGIIWFEGDFNTPLAPGLNYGIISNADFPSSDPLILPSVSAGGTVDMSAAFASVDPVRNTNFTLVPEPTTALLGLLGLAGLLRRKR